MMPKNSVATKLATSRTRYARGSRLATRTLLSVRTASCLEKGARSTVDNANASPSPFSMSQPYASPVPSDHLSSTLLTPAMEVKSLLTRSRMNSAGLVSAVGAWSMPERYSFIFAALPKYATRPIERTITLSKPAKTDAGG